jgi:hypothetical protein
MMKYDYLQKMDSDRLQKMSFSFDESLESLYRDSPELQAVKKERIGVMLEMRTQIRNILKKRYCQNHRFAVSALADWGVPDPAPIRKLRVAKFHGLKLREV